MGDVISTHLDENKREIITARTREVTEDFGRLYEQQYAVALFNSVRYEIEGGGGAQPQLLHRKDPLEGKSIFSGGLFQYLEENKKWRNRFVYVDDTYQISFYENKQAHERGLRPKATLSCAGYKALTSMEEYTQLLNTSLPGVKAKVGSGAVVRCATQFPLILWHPYDRHHYFCVLTEKEQKKWHAVLQDCVRHSNNGLSEDCKVRTPAFTDTVRLHRQRHGNYGTWDLMCGAPPQILANLVMETLHPELRNLIGPRLKGKLQQKQRSWMLISEAVYRQVLSQTQARYEALLQGCEEQHLSLDAALRTDMDQIITSREHVSSKLRAVVLPRAEQLLRGSVQPYLGSILEALMEPTSRGFSEVREVLFRELVEVSKNTLNGGGKEKMGEHMEKISMLAFHPVKMQSCYEQVEQLNLEGLQQRFHVSSASVFTQRAQVLMREQMDNAVYTFEQLLWQSLEKGGAEDLCHTTQRCQDRVLKKYDYDSSTVRKKFFREALLQIIIPFLLKQLSPSCSPEFPRFQEMIFEDFSRFILVENVFEEVVLQSVTKDIMMAVKEAAGQRRHNLYRDSMVLTNSDPNLHLLGEQPGVDWAAQLGVEGHDLEGSLGGGRSSGRKRRQVVSMIHLEGMPPLPYESCLEVPGVELIPEEGEGEEVKGHEPKSPDRVDGIRDLINPVVTVVLPVSLEEAACHSNGMEAGAGTISLGDGVEEEVTLIRTVVEEVHARSPAGKSGQEVEEQLAGSCPQEVEEGQQEVEEGHREVEEGQQEVEEGHQEVEEGQQEVESEEGHQEVEEGQQEVEEGQQEVEEVQQEVESEEGESFTEHAAQEVEIAEQEEDSDQVTECGLDSDAEMAPQLAESSPRCHNDSGFQSPTNEGLDENETQPIVADPEEVAVTLDQEVSVVLNQSESRDLPPGTKCVSEIAYEI